MKKLFLFLMFLTLCSLSFSAQTTEPTPGLKVTSVTGSDTSGKTIGIGSNIKAVSGGVLNGKATSLPKPTFSAEAKAARASGAVSVQVLIDEQGNVMEAEAVSGHELLRPVSKQAALGAKFSPTLLEGQAVKVRGIIVYNFVIPMSFTQIGFDLALLEKSQSFPEDVSLSSISTSFQQNWDKEKADLQRMSDSLKKVSSQPKTTQSVEKISSQLKITQSVNADIAPPGKIGISLMGKFPAEDYDSPERPQIATELIQSLENRLSVNSYYYGNSKPERL